MRSMAAAARAAERNAQRQYKQDLKEQMISDAADAMNNWEEYIDKLSHIHIDNTAPLNWQKIASQPKPSEPSRETTHQNLAQQALDNFQPRFFDFLVGGSEKRRIKLQDAVSRAQALDTEEYETAKEQYTAAVAEWEADKSLANRILKSEPNAYKEAIEEFLSLSKDEFIGTSISISFSEEFVHAKPSVHSPDIVPSFQRKQTASGKLSETKMPIGRFNELYQDYVAGAAFKVASDFLRILPLKEVYVTCLTTMLNTQTGHQEETPILSVRFVRETMAQLDLRRIDPSDALAKFNYAMQFRKTAGFSRIEPLKPLN
jgi:hypothetical protein